MADQSRFERMAQDRDAMAEKLITAMGSLQRALENAGGSSGAGGSIRGSSAASQSSGDSSGFWGSTPKSDSAGGAGLSSIRSLLSAGGASGASSLLGGFASGGALGLGVAAAGMAIHTDREQYRGQREIGQSGLDAMISSPLSASPSEIAFRMRQGERRRAIEVETRENGPDAWSFESLKRHVMGGDYADRQFLASQAQKLRQIDLETAAGAGPADQAKEATINQLAPLARGGADFSNQKTIDIMQDFLNYNYQQARNLHSLRSQMSALDPGAQGRLAGQ